MIALVLGTAALRLFGLPPIDLHGPLHPLGIMDPLCGGTRSALALGGGDFALAWRYNPLVPLLWLGSMGLFVRWCYGATTGRWIAAEITNRRRVIVLGAALLVALWVNQQANVELLMGGPRPQLRLWPF